MKDDPNRSHRGRALSLCLLCAGSACLLALASPRAFSRTQAPKSARGTLTFAERVAYQYGLEEVYWRHRIWPKDNPEPKPRLDAVISPEELEKKVTDYLRRSQALADFWQHPITAAQLQVEMDRMAHHTNQPDVLRELFAALGNDPIVIAECLARPILAERMLTEREGGSSAPPFDAKFNREAIKNSWPSAVPAIACGAADPPDSAYTLPEISVPLDCANDTWTATAIPPGPSTPGGQAVWTGSEMIIWGWRNGPSNTGVRYNLATDSWIATSTANAPGPRASYSGVWTGSEMIIWGGTDGTVDLNMGGRYNPTSDSWAATTTANVPQGRERHTAVWTGREMIIWGGYGCGSNFCILNSGGRYNPSTDSWIGTSTANAP